ncbi:MAG: XTP/dITP diphosphatase [Deltaproteobacteria bacterium]|nr:XTP/dITP diphosphatase [Deltaproteobacteria bacterium]
MLRIVFATKNNGKLREARELLSPIGVELLSTGDYRNIPEIVEDGAIFAENALKKAKAIAATTGELTLADDSGLMVDFLGGAPGVFSARYAGAEANDASNMEKVLAALRNVPITQRGARFVCSLALYRQGEMPLFFEGSLEGIIHGEKAGQEGFGYDPIFYLPTRGCTVAELSLDEKNKISHRAVAFEKLKRYLTSGRSAAW